MISIKLSADNVRLLRGAKTAPELRGAVDLVLERLEQAEAVRLLGKETRATMATKAASKRYNWRVAKEVMGRVLGDQLRAPPFPEPLWYQRVHRAMKQYDLNEEKLLEIAEYAKEHLKPPYSLDFLVCAHERVLAGNFDSKARKGSSTDIAYMVNNWRQNKLPEE